MKGKRKPPLIRSVGNGIGRQFGKHGLMSNAAQGKKNTIVCSRYSNSYLGCQKRVPARKIGQHDEKSGENADRYT